MYKTVNSRLTHDKYAFYNIERSTADCHSGPVADRYLLEHSSRVGVLVEQFFYVQGQSGVGTFCRKLADACVRLRTT